MTPQNPDQTGGNVAREFWITFKPYMVDPLGPCTNILKYVATFAHEHGLHVIEYSAYDALKKERDELAARLYQRHIIGKSYPVNGESINALAGELVKTKQENAELKARVSELEATCKGQTALLDWEQHWITND